MDFLCSVPFSELQGGPYTQKLRVGSLLLSGLGAKVACGSRAPPLSAKCLPLAGGCVGGWTIRVRNEVYGDVAVCKARDASWKALELRALCRNCFRPEPRPLILSLKCAPGRAENGVGMSQTPMPRSKNRACVAGGHLEPFPRTTVQVLRTTKTPDLSRLCSDLG